MENRDAVLRLAGDGALLGNAYWNVEFRTSDASHNPYLTPAAMISAVLAGPDESLVLPAPITNDPDQWTEENEYLERCLLFPFRRTRPRRPLIPAHR
ncbi:hypothetical protein [Rhodococcus sp. 24CO]|uniref:hypothetical protein n=1 Tax=Rhodococcus sp. 24CO TaxID=3117460 RepID=UPI003D33B149